MKKKDIKTNLKSSIQQATVYKMRRQTGELDEALENYLFDNEELISRMMKEFISSAYKHIRQIKVSKNSADA